MTVQFRIISALFFTAILTGCGTVYFDQPMQPAPTPVSGSQQAVVIPQQPQQVVYPSQPQAAQVPAPIQTPPLPPSVPAKPVAKRATSVMHTAPAVIPAGQPISSGDMPVMPVAPEKPAGSMSALPDPS